MSRGTNNRHRITADLGGADLYRAVRFAAIEQEMTVREVVVQALRKWLEQHPVLAFPRNSGANHGQ